MERSFTLCNGDKLVCTEKTAIFTFSGPRIVLSSSANGGGLRDDLTAAFNYCDCGRAGICQPMEGATLREHQIAVARRLGLDPEHTAGLDTAANLDNMVVVTKTWEDLRVTAAVSGGADGNALCAGDPATLTERDGDALPCAAGYHQYLSCHGPPPLPRRHGGVDDDGHRGENLRPPGSDAGQRRLPASCHGDRHRRRGCDLRHRGAWPPAQRGEAFQIRRTDRPRRPGGRGGGASAPDRVLRAEPARGIQAPAALWDHKSLPHVPLPDAGPGTVCRDSAGAGAPGPGCLPAGRCGALRPSHRPVPQRDADRSGAGDWANHLLSEIQTHYRCPLPLAQDAPLPERLEQLLCDLLVAHLRNRTVSITTRSRSDATQSKAAVDAAAFSQSSDAKDSPEGTAARDTL